MAKTKTSHKNAEAEWFGFEKVNPADKLSRVIGVFDSVADRYDLMNDLMSGGIHRLWKDRFVSMMRPRAGKSLLDVAGGTGDIAFRYRKKAGPEAEITVADINAEMLRVGRARAIDRNILKGIEFVEADAQDLPFADDHFDLYSISFGLRNVPRIDDALEEAFRVLKPGGAFYCLEFSRVNNPMLRAAYDAWSFHAIPQIGALVTDDRDSYQYLVESIRQFPRQQELAARMEKAGFENVQYKNLTGGIAAIHVGYKL